MSIAILTDVYDETRRLAIAGSGLSSGDFRLNKLIAPLKQASAKAPIFGKVAQAIGNVVESDAKSASAALLELSTLVTAILYTQGNTGAEGRLEPIVTSGFAMPTSDSSARVLKPLIEALTTTGSGRMEVIQDAYERGAFVDLRLVRPALAAIDDVYGEIGEFVANKILPLYGKAILPDLRASYEAKGKGGHVRRLCVMHRLDPEGTHDLVELALESGSKEMKVAAIGCLKGSKVHVPSMLEQVRAKAKDVRQAAYNALARFTETEVVDAMIKGLSGGDIELVAGPASENRSPRLLEHLLAEGRNQLEAMLAQKDKTKQKTAISRCYQLLAAFHSRDDNESIKFLNTCFEQREAIAKLKGGAVNGESVNQRVASLMARSNAQPAQKALVDAHETLPPNSLYWAMVAATHIGTPKQVYKQFIPYYAADVSKKRGKNPAQEKKEIVRHVLSQLAGSPRHHYFCHDDFEVGKVLDEVSSIAKLDPAWLDAAVEADDVAIVCALAKPRHKAANAFLAKTMEQRLAKSTDMDYEYAEILRTMIRVDHPDTLDFFLRSLEKSSKTNSRYYYAWWLVRLIPDLPKSAAPKIAALLPTLSERIVDEVIPHLEALRIK